MLILLASYYIWSIPMSRVIWLFWMALSNLSLVDLWFGDFRLIIICLLLSDDCLLIQRYDTISSFWRLIKLSWIVKFYREGIYLGIQSIREHAIRTIDWRSSLGFRITVEDLVIAEQNDWFPQFRKIQRKIFLRWIFGRRCIPFTPFENRWHFHARGIIWVRFVSIDE